MAEPAKEKKRVPEFVSFEEALDALCSAPKQSSVRSARSTSAAFSFRTR